MSLPRTSQCLKARLLENPAHLVLDFGVQGVRKEYHLFSQRLSYHSACDHCRKSKSKCKPGTRSGRCANCETTNLSCEYSGPSRKRGPAKGYIKSIFSQVDASAFGPSGRQSHSGPPASSSKDSSGSTVDPLVTGPTNQWQLQIIEEFTQRVSNNQSVTRLTDQDRQASSAFSVGSSMTDPRQPSSTAVNIAVSGDDGRSSKESDEDHGNLGSNPGPGDNALSSRGQLSTDDSHQGRFIAIVHDEVSDDSHRFVIMAMRVGSLFSEGAENLQSHKRRFGENVPLNRMQASSTLDMPSREVQEHLLNIHFTYTYACFPIVHPSEVMEKFRQCWNGSSEFNCSVEFRLILLAIFSLSARHSTRFSAARHETQGIMLWEAGNNYFNQAKEIINRTYDVSKPETCQALLLLATREFGVGAMAEAWLYTGMAIRMAQDLGMHRAADGWRRNGQSVFTSAQKWLRKRIWSSCVKLDRYISMYMGRPIMIHESDYDTELPEELADEEQDFWRPDPERPQAPHYKPVQGGVTSCCHADSRLCRIIARILDSLYLIQKTRSRSDRASRTTLNQDLETWQEHLPELLQLPDYEAISRAPPHVLILHLQYWTAVVLLHRPFIRFEADSKDPELPAPLTKCIEACDKISELVSAYRLNFSLETIPPFVSFEIFGAGIIRAAVVKMKPSDQQSAEELKCTIDFLSDIEIVWPSAAVCRRLLEQSKQIGPSEQTMHDGPDAAGNDAFHWQTDPRPFMSQLFDLPGTFERDQNFHELWSAAMNPVSPRSSPVLPWQNDSEMEDTQQNDNSDSGKGSRIVGELRHLSLSTDRSTMEAAELLSQLHRHPRA
ncbi:hypothetical protein SISNIDRAFT_550782 [Sistotremastrum niveocremeum HHB9708]|uniref:Zn(2)-C6 fungal-type domain-containing protein n=1 Tax=Sistotremastrum niveocremeum HHB9708 TaxID=1314777 RepID=A0A164T3M6_9AGAM|nr:hypothetical protein SISNIDRAFT_550782 [Sistotremastrum niveocremeum HHB9708]